MTPKLKLLSTKIEPDGIRNTIPDDFFLIAALLKQSDWQLKVKTTPHGVCVSASIERWNGMYADGYHWGYLSDNKDATTIVELSRRLAELTFRIKETFVDTFPSGTVDENGIIHEDLEFYEASKLGEKHALEFIIKRHEVRNSCRADDSFRNELKHKRGIIHLQWDAQLLYLKAKDVYAIEEFIRGQCLNT